MPGNQSTDPWWLGEIAGIQTGAGRAYQVRSATRQAAACALAEIDRLRKALSFAASVIKSGEPWTETCEREIGGLLK